MNTESFSNVFYEKSNQTNNIFGMEIIIYEITIKEWVIYMPVLPVLQLGSTGPYVQLLQINLNGLGGNFNNFAIDGVFGIKTQQAVGSY